VSSVLILHSLLLARQNLHLFSRFQVPIQLSVSFAVRSHISNRLCASKRCRFRSKCQRAAEKCLSLARRSRGGCELSQCPRPAQTAMIFLSSRRHEVIPLLQHREHPFQSKSIDQPICLRGTINCLKSALGTLIFECSNRLLQSKGIVPISSLTTKRPKCQMPSATTGPIPSPSSATNYASSAKAGPATATPANGRTSSPSSTPAHTSTRPGRGRTHHLDFIEASKRGIGQGAFITHRVHGSTTEINAEGTRAGDEDEGYYYAEVCRTTLRGSGDV